MGPSLFSHKNSQIFELRVFKTFIIKQSVTIAPLTSDLFLLSDCRKEHLVLYFSFLPKHLLLLSNCSNLPKDKSSLILFQEDSWWWFVKLADQTDPSPWGDLDLGFLCRWVVLCVMLRFILDSHASWLNQSSPDMGGGVHATTWLSKFGLGFTCSSWK